MRPDPKSGTPGEFRAPLDETRMMLGTEWASKLHGHLAVVSGIRTRARRDNRRPTTRADRL